MNKYLNNNTSDLLNEHYKKLFAAIETEGKKLIHDSIYLTLIDLLRNKNRIFKIFSRSYLKVSQILESEKKELLDLRFIAVKDESNAENLSMITMRGIWFIESQSSTLDIDGINNYFDNSIFGSTNNNEPLNDKEKIIICSLISLRCFSENTSMNLNQESLTDKWFRLIKVIIIPFLESKRVINKIDHLSKRGYEHPLEYMMRRANNLPPRTNGVYIATRSKKYFLNLAILDQSKCKIELSTLLSKVFTDISSISELQSIKEFLVNIPNSQSPLVTSNFEYINTTWDKIICDSIEIAYVNSTI